MEITAVTGERDVNLNNWCCDRQSNLIKFPEAKAIHPYDLFDEVMNIIQESFESDQDLIILTYSEIVFNTVRLWVARNHFEGALLVYMHDDRSGEAMPMSKDGEIDSWPRGMFDLEQKILHELIGIKLKQKHKGNLTQSNE